MDGEAGHRPFHTVLRPDGHAVARLDAAGDQRAPGFDT